MSLLNTIKKDFSQSDKDITIQEYLNLCKKDKVYSSPAERMLEAIGEPEVIETKLDERLSRIYSNKIIKRYPAFHEFFGMEDTIEQIVSFFKHAAQGLEFRRPLQAAVWTEALHAQFRALVPALDTDRILATDMHMAQQFLQQYLAHE